MSPISAFAAVLLALALPAAAAEKPGAAEALRTVVVP